MGRRLANDRLSVFAASDEGGSEPAVEFLDGLPEDQRGRMTRRFEKLAAGLRLNKQDFRQLRGKIYEFKDYQRRMLCFKAPGGWYVTHGFIKKTSAATPNKEIERAERIEAHHLARSRNLARTTDAKPKNRRGRKKK